MLNSFQNSIFNQQTATPQNVPPGARGPESPPCYATARVTINDSNQSHFHKISERLMGKLSSFAHKEMSASLMFNTGANFLFSLHSRAMLLAQK